ncbi:hypothetical protein PR048_001161 [Dryococelus australis]|uniref:DPAGT1 insertion domain-containing protein n=1 Tax=Dryococelus australis TaxID=614101 RepID=A0ABQ9IJ13_9NEOP|nr:hypothetical protein PR048_001161 [Dryococelus australis]
MTDNCPYTICRGIAGTGVLSTRGAVVAERLACSPPTKANQVQSLTGSLDFPMWESCWMMPLVGGFSRGSPIFPALSLRHCSILASITFISSQDLAVKSRPNLLTHLSTGVALSSFVCKPSLSAKCPKNSTEFRQNVLFFWFTLNPLSLNLCNRLWRFLFMLLPHQLIDQDVILETDDTFQHLKHLFHGLLKDGRWDFMSNGRYPSQVFVGDTFCYFSGMTFAVVGILGHFSKMLLLFFIPQVINFVYSVPQLFHFIPCPRHRLPRYNASTDQVEMSKTKFRLSEQNVLGRVSIALLRLLHLVHLEEGVGEDAGYVECNNLTLLNLVLLWRGPMNEETLVRHLLALQLYSDMDLEVAAAAYMYTNLALRKKKKRRRWWQTQLFELKEQYGGSTLMADLKFQHVRRRYKNVTRVSPVDFGYLISLVGGKIEKKYTNPSQAISVQDRLAVTLTFLATGDSYSSLQCIGQIVLDVCQALVDKLAEYSQQLELRLASDITHPEDVSPPPPSIQTRTSQESINTDARPLQREFTLLHRTARCRKNPSGPRDLSKSLSCSFTILLVPKTLLFPSGNPRPFKTIRVRKTPSVSQNPGSGDTSTPNQPGRPEVPAPADPAATRSCYKCQLTSTNAAAGSAVSKAFNSQDPGQMSSAGSMPTKGRPRQRYNEVCSSRDFHKETKQVSRGNYKESSCLPVARLTSPSMGEQHLPGMRCPEEVDPSLPD